MQAGVRGHTQPYSYHSDWPSSEGKPGSGSGSGSGSAGRSSKHLALWGGPLMLLTRDVLSDRMAWFLAPPVTAGSLKMESRKMESTVKEGPRKACRLDGSGSSTRQGMLADLGRAGSLYSLWERAGVGSTSTGCRLSLESRSWMLVRRTEPSAVEMTLLARGRPAAESSRSDRDADDALLCAERPARGGAEPLERVLSALRRLGRPG